jgi:biotin operon repressor
MKDEIREAFKKVKQDIFALGSEIQQLRFDITDQKNEIKLISSFIDDLRAELPGILREKEEKQPEITPTHIPTHPTETPTIRQIIPTHEEIPTDKLLSQVLRGQNLQVSTGNQGVPTDKQTNRQTNRHIIQHIKTEEKPLKKLGEDHLKKADEILASLDALKKEVRLKFKRLTTKEMQVFSLLYSLENQGEIVDYPLLAGRLTLSESSIRDYIGRLQKKGIPITKEKIANKKIILHISSKLKKIASLDTILRLREI